MYISNKLLVAVGTMFNAKARLRLVATAFHCKARLKKDKRIWGMGTGLDVKGTEHTEWI